MKYERTKFRKLYQIHVYFCVAFSMCIGAHSVDAATPQDIVIPCAPTKVAALAENNSLIRAKGDMGTWTFKILPGLQNMQLKDQIWTYPGKGQINSPWGNWQGGDGTNQLTWSGPQMSAPFNVTVKARRLCPGQIETGPDYTINGSWSGEVKDVVVKFSTSPIGICTPGGTTGLGIEITPAALANQVVFDTVSPAIATIPANSGAPNITITGVAAGQTTLRALINGAPIATLNINVGIDTTFERNKATVRQVTPSDDAIRVATEVGLHGLTYVERVSIEYTACLQGEKWKAVLTGVNLDYSAFASFEALGVKDITGVGGAEPGTTTQENYCQQVTHLKANPINLSIWDNSAIVGVHEQVHANHLAPFLEDFVPIIVINVSGTEINHVNGMTKQQAIDAMKPAIVTTENFASDQISIRLGNIAKYDHFGPTGSVEAGQIGPAFQGQVAAYEALAADICVKAAQQIPVWDACAACN